VLTVVLPMVAQAPPSASARWTEYVRPAVPLNVKCQIFRCDPIAPAL